MGGNDCFECENGGVSRPQPTVTSQLASQSKIAAYLFLAIAFVVAIGMGFFVVGPFVADYVHGQNHQQPMQKAFFAHSAPASARKINIAMSDSIKTGKVKYVNLERAIAFIEDKDNGMDYFVDNVRSLVMDQKVEFKVITDGNGKTTAIELTGPAGGEVLEIAAADEN